MVTAEDLIRLRANPGFLAEELQKRGVEVTVIDWNNEIVEARYRGRTELLLDIDSSLMPYTATSIASSKSVTKTLLQRRGISVPQGEGFRPADKDKIHAFCRDIEGPYVVKPSVGSQGKLVFVDLESAAEVFMAVDKIEQTEGDIEVLVEEYIPFQEFRIFLTSEGDYAVLHRDPAHVIGDGRASIEALIAQENVRRRGYLNCLRLITADDTMRLFLRKNGLTFSSIPGDGEKVYVTRSSNVSLGGVPVDMTDAIHPSALEIAFRALKSVPGLPYAGIDFMTEDISAPQREDSYAILELNPLPGIGIHMAPGRGKSRNVAGMIADMIFPETRAMGVVSLRTDFHSKR